MAAGNGTSLARVGWVKRVIPEAVLRQDSFRVLYNVARKIRGE